MTLLPAWPLMAPPASADSAATTGATLPSPREATSAIWDGTHAFVFGGWTAPSSRSSQIVRYVPSSNSVTTMSDGLPWGRDGTSAIWDGTNAYIFGGRDSFENYMGQIVRYNPATNVVTIMSATLPSPRGFTAAVWDGTNAYIFGGTNGTANFADIVRYNPTTNTVTTMSATLPTPRYGSSAVWDGTNAYVFVGNSGYTTFNEVVRYSPATNAVTVMTNSFPVDMDGTSAAWDGSYAYVFGGWGSNFLDTVIRYSPSTNTFVTMSGKLPTGRAFTSAVWAGSNAYVFGGCTTGFCNGNGYVSEIVRYNLTPGAPQSPSAARGPGVGEITLSWQPPASNTYSSSITGYKIYRGTASSGETFLTQVGNVLSYTDTGLGNGVTRYYKVSAVNAAGESVQSAERSATTFQVPDAPQSLAASQGSGIGEISLSWQAPWNDGGKPVTGYRIDRGSSPGTETFLTQVGTVLSYTDTGLDNGATWYYKVSAVNAAGEGAQSNEASATTRNAPSAPQNLQAYRGWLTEPNVVDLSWSPPSSNGGSPITNYEIYRGTSAGSETFLAEIDTCCTANGRYYYTDSSCPTLSTCYYKVAAKNAVGVGTRSAEIGIAWLV